MREGIATPLAGRRALVTGAGRGLGAAIAERLAEGGATVVLAARTASEIEAVAARLATAGHRALAVATDVTDETAVERLVRRAGEAFGPVEILVNVAGAAASAPLAKITLAEWNRLFAVNATSAFLTTRALAPAMAEAGWGRIVNVASVAGLGGGRYIAHYTAAKHALVGFTRAAAIEFAGRGVGIHAVCPGYADTPMTAETIARVRERTGRSAEESLAAVLASSRQQRLVTPSEVAEAVLRLCGSEGTGEIVVLTGGSAPDLPLEVVNPEGLPPPKGFSHGVLAPPGARVLHVAGEPGWSADLPGEPPAFAVQFARALDQVLAVVQAAGGEAREVARLTLYVTDLAAYRAARRELGPLWRERFGTYDPAVALVEVRGLVDRGALVEIEATALLGGSRP